MEPYLPLLTMFVLAVLFAGISFAASQLLAPKRSTQAKRAPYECGIVPTYEPPARFPVRFYIVAMIFIILDVEVIFLFPWAVYAQQLGAYGLWEMTLFAVAVVTVLAYLFSTGAFEWGPTATKKTGVVASSSAAVKRVSRSDHQAQAEPTTEASRGN